MRAESITALGVPAGAAPLMRSESLGDYWALTKPDVNLLIVITTFAGFCLASSAEFRAIRVLLLFHTLVGTLLVAGGSGTLNQFIERQFDAQMRRTKRRPLAAGRIQPLHAFWFGIFLSAAGTIYLAAAVNVLASTLAVLTLLSYLILYTPLKRKTALCTLIGALPGAVPPLIGWAAASGRLSPEAWVLYGIVFFWQFPHFMAIAWMYREDYDRAGYLVLPKGRRRSSFMAWQSVLPSLALVPLSLAPTLLGNEGLIYGVAALLFSVCLFYYGTQLSILRNNVAAHRLLVASILYLPLLFVLMVLDRA